MGYTTNFTGKFNLDKPLTEAHAAYLNKFNKTRRVKRNPEKAATLQDPVRTAVGLPVGDEGGYFVGGVGFMGQGNDESVTNGNKPPAGQPQLWCGWTPSSDGNHIEWDNSEKFYSYIEWLRYIIAHFLQPWGYVLNGQVKWQGEDTSDNGTIVVENNVVSI